MRILTRRSTRSHAPFTGEGASLYLNGQFRKLRVDCGICTCGPESRDVDKTARVAFALDPTASITYSTVGLESATTVYQVRTFKDGVENESNFRPLTVTLDADGADATAILGTATFYSTENRAGGIVRILFRWNSALSGIQPNTFTAIRTAGPSSPANATTSAIGGGLYSIDTPALLDTAPYTYKIQASYGATTADVLTGIVFTADATGPTAPTNGTVEII